MKPETIGRVLGIGLRVAGRMAGQRLTATAQAPQSAQPGATQRAANFRPQSGLGPDATPSLRRGIAGFFRPFQHVGRMVWLEVVGVFFLLPVIVFVPTLWRTRASWQHGPDHRTFVSAAIVIAIFLYLGVTSFWRARHKSQ